MYDLVEVRYILVTIFIYRSYFEQHYIVFLLTKNYKYITYMDIPY